ncbi:MAG: NifU family protein [Iamia sp.]
MLDALRASPDPRASDRAEELVRLLTDLYGAGLARVMAVAGEHSPELVDHLAADDLVSSLLSLHDLHPEGVRARVEAALASVRPMLAEHGGDVELLDVDEGVGAVLIRLLGSCDGCASSASTLQHAVEVAIHTHAPEVGIIDVEEPTPEPAAPVPIALGQKPQFDSCPAEPVAP